MAADNVQGFHAGMIRLFKEEGFKMFKWPGGNFVSSYDWRDGLGDRDKRPPRGNESNDVGLHDFIALNRLVGAEPDLTVNSGYGSAREAAEAVEYCNGSVNTRMGRMRAENGSAEPFNPLLDDRQMYGWRGRLQYMGEYQHAHRSRA
jgi:alpha-N-arabinofuranosidase